MVVKGLTQCGRRWLGQTETPVVPSVGETVETCAWLSEVLAKGLLEDMEEDRDLPLREADIE